MSKILEAATELFLEIGYDKTAIDAIVEKSGGSKATLYSYFPTKADLFRAVVDNIVPLAATPTKRETCEDIRGALREFGEARLQLELSECHQALLRLVIAAREQFPDLAEMYYERGPKMSYDSLVAYLTSLMDDKKLDIDDVQEAAELFIGMLLYPWCSNQLLLRGQRRKKVDISQRVASVVDRFLRLYHP